MVLLIENKLIIEIETETPRKDLIEYQTAIIDVLRVYDYEMNTNSYTLPLFSLLQETFKADIQPGKITITYNDEPKETLNYWQNGINDILSLHDYEKFGAHFTMPLLSLLQELIQVVDKQTEILKPE